MTKKTVTAAELMARLNADPKFVARRAEEERQREQRAAEWQRAEAPLIEELRGAGYSLESVWDLVNSAGSYPAALPILLAHLARPYPGPVREGIARALAVPESKMGWDHLMRLYRNEQDPRARNGLAVAIAAAADDELILDVIGLAQDTRNGPSRLLLLPALEKSADPRAQATLKSLERDPELTAEVQVILRRRKRRK